MKKTWTLSLAAVLMLLGSTSCNKNEKEVDGSNAATTAMTVTLVAPPGARATGTPTKEDENKITSMEILVFHKGSGNLDKRGSITGLTGKVLGLKTGAKTVVVVANPTAALKTQLDAVTNYAELKDVAKANVDLLDQLDADGKVGATGLTMRGEMDVVLKSRPEENKVTLQVNRVVAKVKLGKITVTPNPGYDPAKLTISKVYIEKARNKSLLGFGSYLIADVATPPTLFKYLGGKAATVSTTEEARLSGPAAVGDNTTYFYVLPNDNATGNCTLMTLEGAYDGKPWYYVFRINDKEITGEPTTGKFIEANHFYSLNITLKSFDGSTDPEDPGDPADIDVTIEPIDWIVVPTQEVEW